VVEGTGTAYIESPAGKAQFDFTARDHFVVPSWHTLRLTCAQGCVLFSYSDRPVHQALGIHREERLEP
jgi:gentisate 1,2-dioxygenase